MVIHYEDIKEGGLFLEASESAQEFPVLQEMVAAGELTVSAPIRFKVKVSRVQEMVEVEGRVETVLRVSCSGCLKEFDAPLFSSFALTFVRDLPSVTDETGEEVELTAEEMGLISFQGEEIDLRPVLQEQIIMTLPVRPLCREDCKGLCPQCGADLNEKECGCSRPVLRNAFAALKDFRVDKEKT